MFDRHFSVEFSNINKTTKSFSKPVSNCQKKKTFATENNLHILRGKDMTAFKIIEVD